MTGTDSRKKPINKGFYCLSQIKLVLFSGEWKIIRSLPEMAVRPEGGVQMSKYEVMYIINANVEEEKRSALIEQLSGIITSEGGKVLKTTEWGMRDFAYEIDDMTKGYYVIVTFEAENAGLKEFDRLMRINPSIVRFMIVNIDDKPETKESK